MGGPERVLRSERLENIDAALRRSIMVAVMSLIRVPYHLDEHLSDFNVPLPATADLAEVIVDLPEADLWARLVRLNDAVAASVERLARAGSKATVVSGDCTVSIGIAAGLQRASVEPSIVWVDAHGDLQTQETTPSGYVGGMALRLLLGYRRDLIAGPLGLRQPSEARVVLVGARDLDPPEVDYLASAEIRQASIDDLSEADLPAGPLLLNLDLDVLDPTALPGLRYPAAGGPHLPAVLRAARTVVASGRLAALNLACTWLPGQPDPERIRERVVAGVLASLWDDSSGGASGT